MVGFGLGRRYEDLMRRKGLGVVAATAIEVVQMERERDGSGDSGQVNRHHNLCPQVLSLRVWNLLE